MNRILKTLVGVAAMAALSANADPLLYWMVEQDGSGEWWQNVSFDIAKVAYNTDGSSTAAGYLSLVDENGGTASAIAGNNGSTAATWADLAGLSGDLSAYSFFVELLSWNGSSYERSGQSTAVSYSDLVTNHKIIASSLDIGTMSTDAWVAPGVAIPEPSGALLMLVGGSLLALRRRRKVA